GAGGGEAATGKRSKQPLAKRSERASPKRPKPIAAKKAKPTTPKRGKRPFPKKTGQTSFAAMQARIGALEAQNVTLKTQSDALRVELRESQARETATADVLGVINYSPANLSPVFHS